MKVLGWLGFLGGLGALLAGCLGTPGGPGAVGKHAPQIEGVDSHGRPFQLADYHGKVVLLEFWRQG
jgi:cytochrome oxidase Cu insertion factor (SCO1/SenC/PrrC family)